MRQRARRGSGARDRSTAGTVGRAVRAQLQRRLFLWFGATILLTSLAVGAALAITSSRGGMPGHRPDAGLETFVAQSFARVWDDPVERAALAEAIARNFDVGVRVEAGEGRERATIVEVGPRCSRPWVVPVRGDARLRGAVSICSSRGALRRALRFALPALAACLVLWAASGFLARRLARPLHRVAQMAERVGAGDLSARVPIPERDGEERTVAIALNEMAERIERMMAGERELLATVSHELRTPLARLRLLVEMAREGAASEKILADLDAEVLEIDALVGELLARSRLDFGVHAARAINAREAVERALVRAGLPVDRLRVDAVGRSAFDPEVEADATLLARALANLVDNAEHHGGGLSAIELRGDADHVSFSVLDRGPGLEDEAQSRIFDPFHQGAGDSGAASRADARVSLGLGLALVRRIAEAHGGSVFARRRDAGGAEVGFRLPRRQVKPT